MLDHMIKYKKWTEKLNNSIFIEQDLYVSYLD